MNKSIEQKIIAEKIMAEDKANLALQEDLKNAPIQTPTIPPAVKKPPSRPIPPKQIKNAITGRLGAKNKTLIAVSDIKLSKKLGFSPEQLDLVKRTVAKGATNDELAMFIHIAKKSDLDPFLKQVWFYKDNKGNAIIFTGRDGFLAIAQKSGEFAGIQSGTVYEGDKFLIDYSNPENVIVNHETNPFSSKKILGAWARSRRKNCIDTVEIVKWENYNKGYNVWKTHPEAMITKCAESIVLRKQYGISGLSSQEELGYGEQNDIQEVDTDKLFTDTKAIMEKLPANKKNQAIENIISSGQFSEEQVLEIQTLKILDEKKDATN